MKIASNKFAIIHDIINTPGNVLRIDELCKTAGVSRSGYYNWLKSEDKRLEYSLFWSSGVTPVTIFMRREYRQSLGLAA